MRKTVLIILDGWGIGNKTKSDAIYNANTPFVDSLYKNYPNATLKTSGFDVGLPDGQMGNSEVGHLNIGAGRVVYQDFAKINKAILDNSIEQNSIINEAFEYAKKNDKAVHFLGLVSDGGVHSHTSHLKKLCDMATDRNLDKVYIHAFTDGRDTDPHSGIDFIENILEHVKNQPVKLASIIGRYYAMDRDNRWERVKLAYDLLVSAIGEIEDDPIKAIQKSYDAGISDEFLQPISFEPEATIKEGDVVICFNFRTDRCREITKVLTQQDFPEHKMKTIPLYFVTMTKYDDGFKDVKIIYEKDNLSMTMGEVLEKAGKTQIRIAETEKYPHVTFFFSGGRENEFVGEKRIMASSPKVATYDLQPEMSALEITSKICAELEKGETDFVCLNFANPDMVGHTGVYEAVVKAVETVDSCTKKVVETGLKNDYSFIIIADHGNADYVVNEDGSPNTAHTTNPVPLFLIDAKNEYKNIKDGRLADIAPTLLKLMDIPQPKEMDGVALV